MTDYIHPGIFCRGEFLTYPNGAQSFLFDIHTDGEHALIILSADISDNRFVYYTIRQLLLNVTESILTHGSTVSKHIHISDVFRYATGYKTNLRVQKHETN